MGITHLISHLSPYATETILGCSTANCTSHKTPGPITVIIDGPALAYHIYHRLLTYKAPTLNALEAQPSYGELGKSAVLYLDELSRHKIIIENIFFDGFLPPTKRIIRLSRLESSLKQLVKFNSTHSNGLSTQEDDHDLFVPTVSMLFDSSRPTPSGLRGLPASPFLVPAVIDALVASRYAGIFDIAPGEADAFCASAVRTSGGTVLTSDSDLLVYNLGQQGRVAFFSRLELHDLDVNGCHILKSGILTPIEIAKRLDLPDLTRLAFELQLDTSVTLHAAVQRAKKPHKGVQEAFDFVAFSADYKEDIVPFISSWTAFTSLKGDQVPFNLDPRVSELILQSRSPASKLHMYLPFLIDDPPRVSAWEASSDLRWLAYSLLLKDSHGTRSICEFGRKGFRIMPRSASVLEHSQCRIDAKRFKDLVDAVRERLPNVTSFAFWRIFAMILVMSWYKTSERNLPLHDTITKTLFRTSSGKTSWEAIQLSAQYQGVIYSIRMMKQILGCLAASKTAKGKTHIVQLLGVLEDLPPLSALLPSNAEFGRDSQYLLDAHSAVGIIKEFTYWKGSLDELAEVGEVSSINSQVVTQTGDEEVGVVKKRKKSRTRKKRSEKEASVANSVEKKNNLYSILAQT